MQSNAWWTPVPHVRGPLEVGERPTPDRYQWLVESVQEVIFEADPQGRWTYLNPAWTRVLGYDTADCLGKPFLDYVHPEDREANLDVFVQTLTSGKENCRFEARYLSASGGVRWMEINAWIFRDEDGGSLGSTGTLTDVTDRRLAELELERRATHDPLTALPNRSLLDEQLSAAIHRSATTEHPLALLFLDLDRFKLVNDSLGHDAGDEVLRIVGERLRRGARPGDVVCRFGGDEFVVLAEGMTTAALRPFARRLHSAVGAPIAVSGRELVLSVSVGACLLPADTSAEVVAAGKVAETAIELLRDADSAMYQAKEAGRDRTEVFSVATRDRIVARFDTETELRHAIAHGELSLAYQPQIDLRSGRVVGFEALVRWDHPERGRLLPATFMSVAEESGLVVPLGRWVLAEVCRTLAADQQSGNRLPRVAINISACEISSEFVTDLAELVTETGARPTALCLELTESVLLADADSARVIMTELADLGVQLSLDDFGTGYSSLAMLKQLPLRELKIDRSFVNQLHEPDGRSLVEAVIGMANALGLDTVAEGVEQPDQARSLGELGCAMGQGYLFGHPLPLAQALAYRPMVPTQRSNDTHRVRSGTWRGIDRPSPGPSEEPRASEVFPATR